MVDWNKELEIYTIEEILEYNDVNPEEAMSYLDLEYALEIPAVSVDAQV